MELGSPLDGRGRTRGRAALAQPSGLVLERLELHDGRALLADIASGRAWTLDRADTATANTDADPPDPGGSRPTGQAAAVRLALLYWCWAEMPVPTPTAMWQIEAAALGVSSGLPGLTNQVLPGLRAALAELSRGVWTLPAPIDSLLHDIGRVASAADTIAGAEPLLWELVEQLHPVVGRRRAKAARPGRGPLPSPGLSGGHDGRFSVEWDRVPIFQLDPRELAVHAAVSGDSWRVSAPALVTRSWRRPPSPIWARLIDRDDLRVVSAMELVRAGDLLYAGAGALPADGNLEHWRVDLTENPDQPPRPPSDLTRRHAEQALFRALLLGRSRSASTAAQDAVAAGPAWARAVAATAALRAQLDPAEAALTTIPDAMPPPPAPFLAETLVDPSAVTRFVSPAP